ncbi:glycoside hydrolase family 3 N-terminal domain-containing protein [Pontivivens ytuae]
MAAIFGLEGKMPSEQERAFFKEADPWGFIVFDRNLGEPDEIRALTSELRALMGRDVPILIDQEGGRVQRLRSPHFREWMPPLDFMQHLPEGMRVEAMRKRYRYIAHELYEVGIDVNCAPMLDLARDDTHVFLRNRCYGTDPKGVAEIGKAVSEGLLAGGVLPVAKHIPGHGRGLVDSHHELPVVEAGLTDLMNTDFAPFTGLIETGMAMTAHVVYDAFDRDNCATMSADVITHIRDRLGFVGLLMTDDLSMKALTGSFAERTERAIAAGCDMILHCNGDMAEMEGVASAAPALAGPALNRAQGALAQRQAPDEVDIAELGAELDELEREAGHA